MSASQYMTVNVYPTQSGWYVATFLREAGRPYPRTVGVVYGALPLGSHHSLKTALAAAADALSEAAELRQD